MRTALTALFALIENPNRTFNPSPDSARLTGTSHHEIAGLVRQQLSETRDMLLKARTNLHLGSPLLECDAHQGTVDTTLAQVTYKFGFERSTANPAGRIKLEALLGEKVQQRNSLVEVRDFCELEKITDRFAMAAASLLRSYDDQYRIHDLPEYRAAIAAL